MDYPVKVQIEISKDYEKSLITYQYVCMNSTTKRTPLQHHVSLMYTVKALKTRCSVKTISLFRKY